MIGLSKKLIGFLLILLNTLILISCSSTQQYNTAYDDIHAALQDSSRSDKALTKQYQSKQQPPLAVQNALLPPVALNTTAANNQNIEPRFDVSVKDAPAKAFFMGLVQGTNYNMVVNPDVTGTISVNLRNVTVEEALEAVADAYGYDYRRTPYGFEVSPPGLETKIFNVNYLNVQRQGQSQTSLNPTQLSEDAGPTTSGTSSTNSSPTTNNTSSNTAANNEVNTRSQMDFWTKLTETLKTMIGDQNGRSVVVNPEAGIVIVHAYPDEIREVAKYLNSTQNSMERQVIIEAKILEVQLNDGFQSGINWNLMGFHQTGIALLPNQGTDAMTNVNLDGRIGGQNFDGIINLLETQGNVQVLSSPRVSTVNNQKAVIKVGDDRFFVTSVTSNVTPTGSSSTTSSSVGLTPFFGGITLDVTPQISNEGDIILQIHPSISTVKDEVRTINLGSNNVLQLPLAASTIRESDSIVRAHNGQVIIIGGLMENDMSEHLKSTPGLSRAPFFGTLFRNTKQESRKTELVILLKPVVTDNSTWANQLDDSTKNFGRLDRGFHIGSRPEIFGTKGETFSQ